MENFGEWDQKKLKNELLKGKDLAKQLQIHLNVKPSPSPSPSSSSSMAASSSSSSFSNDGSEYLVQKILCSYEKALSLLNSNGIQISESSPSSLNGGSPRSEDSDREFKDPSDQIIANSSRKRNILPTWTQKFQVSPGMALEGSLDDGFCWRKYGQKGILGAKHPRCTHRNLQSCLASKQVQRSDDDSTVFEITYRGKHSCSQVSNLSIPSTTPPEFQGQNQGVVAIPDQKKVQNQQTSPDAVLNSWTSLRVITQNLDTTTHEPTLSFHYDAADHVESAPTPTVDINFAEFSPCSSFLSPTTSGSGLSYFSASSSGLSEGFVGNQKLNLQPNKSEIFSSPTSALNSQTSALDFPFGEFQMDPTFTFDNTNFFS
ncbi:probable WRKY transcription factor 53 isoform X2 [Benincasa hispida]|uniref:probable WRKY transcription factor 53 isoform X2 n=1 Tax=Benincasa hispida TaxID=102211 RepID=UPI001902314F|nr:probable WRKY transcription factor 53 isoform X2 [Benincasa hispida]